MYLGEEINICEYMYVHIHGEAFSVLIGEQKGTSRIIKEEEEERNERVQ